MPLIVTPSCANGDVYDGDGDARYYADKEDEHDVEDGEDLAGGSQDQAEGNNVVSDVVLVQDAESVRTLSPGSERKRKQDDLRAPSKSSHDEPKMPKV